MIIQSMTLKGKNFDVRLTHVEPGLLKGEVLEPGKRGKRVRAEFNLRGAITAQDVWANILPHLSEDFFQRHTTEACNAVLAEINRIGKSLL